MLPPRLAVRLAWASALSILIAYTAAASIGRTTHGFIAYYGAARLFIDGELSADAYDDRWFNEYVQRITNTGVREIFTPNPPTMSLMAVPFAGLRPPGARTVWLFASILTYAAAIALLLRHAPPKRADLLPLLVFLLLVNPPVLANLRVGQAYLFVAAGYALFAVALIRDRQTLAGATLGVLFALKATGAPLFLLLAATRRWRALAAGIAAIGLAVALTALRVDRAMWAEYPSAVAGMLGRPTIGVTASQSTLSLARRLCVPNADWNPRGPAECPRVAAIAPGALILFALAITVWASRIVPMQVWLSARHRAVRARGTDGRGLSLRGSGRADRPAAVDGSSRLAVDRARRHVAAVALASDGVPLPGRLVVARRLSTAVLGMAAVGCPLFRSS